MTSQLPQNYNHTDPQAFPAENWRKYRRRTYWWGGSILAIILFCLLLGYSTGTEEAINRARKIMLGLGPFGAIVTFLCYRAWQIHQSGIKISGKVLESKTMTVSLVGQRMSFLTMETVHNGVEKINKTSMRAAEPPVKPDDIIIGVYSVKYNKFIPVPSQFSKWQWPF